MCGFGESRAKESDFPHAASHTDGLDQSVGCTLRKIGEPTRVHLSPCGPYFFQHLFLWCPIYKHMFHLSDTLPYESKAIIGEVFFILKNDQVPEGEVTNR